MIHTTIAQTVLHITELYSTLSEILFVTELKQQKFFELIIGTEQLQALTILGF